jgi:hypothetical protein
MIPIPATRSSSSVFRRDGTYSRCVPPINRMIQLLSMQELQ